MKRFPSTLLLPLVLAIAAGSFLTGIDWGLPTRNADPFLFGNRTPWSGAEVQRLVAASKSAGWDDPMRGADVDADARPVSATPVILNATDVERAQIVLRYRLFTHQPDEMITMMSLSKMRPGQGDLDPRLYQYGGLWIYPVGALLKVASVFRLVELRGGPEGLAYYLDKPEAFGRFYVVARLYVVAWGLVGAWAVFRIVRAIHPSDAVAAVATLAFACMPVVVNMAHEAKPHLPGMTLMLLAVLSAARYVESGRERFAWLAGALCGAALGMVLSALPVFILLPLMTLLRPMTWGRRARVAVIAGAIGGAVYAIANPYVVIHLFHDRAVLQSNLGNSTAFYQAGRPLDGLANVALLTADGMTPPLAIAGVLGALLLGLRAIRMRANREPAEVRRRATGLLLAAPALLTLSQAAALAAGKPGEFGRFLLLADVFLAIEGIVAVATFRRPGHWRNATLGFLLFITALGGVALLSRFVQDARPITPRLQLAEQLQQYLGNGPTRVAVLADPAPYGLPPANLFDWQIVKIRRGDDAAVWDWLIRPTDEVAEPDSGVMRRLRWLLPARVSWAAKPFETWLGEKGSPKW